MWEVVYPTSRAVELDAEDDEEEKCMVQSNFTTPIVRLSHELQSDGKTVSCKLLVLAFERISTTFIEAHFLNNESQIVGLVSSGNIKEGCTVTNSLRQTASSDKTCFMHSADGSHEVLFCQCKIDVPPEACHNWANEVCIDANTNINWLVSVQCGKLCNQDIVIGCAILMLSIYSLLIFLNLGGTISIQIPGRVSVSQGSYHRIKISNRRATQQCHMWTRFFMQKYAVYWPEGGAASQYSVFIGQKMSLTG
jgi:hypothetical protein